jgi:hypothetical protein
MLMHLSLGVQWICHWAFFRKRIGACSYWSFGSAHPAVTWSFQYRHGATHLPVLSPKHRQQLPHLADAMNAAFGWLNAMNENEDPLAELAAAAAAAGVSMGPAAAPYQPQPPLVHEAEAVALVYAN